MTADELRRVFRKAMLQTDPDGSEDNRAGAAFLAVLDDLEIVNGATRQEVLYTYTSFAPSARLEWKK